MRGQQRRASRSGADGGQDGGSHGAELLGRRLGAAVPAPGVSNRHGNGRRPAPGPGGREGRREARRPGAGLPPARVPAGFSPPGEAVPPPPRGAPAFVALRPGLCWARGPLLPPWSAGGGRRRRLSPRRGLAGRRGAVPGPFPTGSRLAAERCDPPPRSRGQGCCRFRGRRAVPGAVWPRP